MAYILLFVEHIDGQVLRIVLRHLFVLSADVVDVQNTRTDDVQQTRDA